ncbi:efflux RND transporter periplasmic adaptor subunit [Pedobacter sp. MW01-1-1]|uniref:efflux RND transporter periplasmic adaptor subunit n=1 Tax=Pedobacter sp. MW01-1-1 TaxID=3383027 RepID=UPI003FEDFA5E
MKNTSKNIIKAGSALFLAALLTACGGNKKETEAAVETEVHDENENAVEITAEQYQNIKLELALPEKKALSGLLKVNGFVDVPPQNLVSITSQMGGIISSTSLLQGSSVQKGQVIAVLENQDFVQLQQDYLESKSQLELSSAEYQRQQTLASQNVNSQKKLQQSKSQFQIDKVRENALKQRLRLININAASLTAESIRSRVNIYSPITGYVTKVNVNTGEFVNPNDSMFEIVDNSNLHIELKVFEKDAEKVRAGQVVRFNLTNDDKEQKAVVQLVGKEIATDKTVTVHAIASGSKKFIPGTYLKAYIETGTNEVNALPNSAVINFEGKNYVFIEKAAEHMAKDEGEHGHDEKKSEKEKEAEGQTFHFKMIEVTTGTSDGGYIQVDFPKNIDTTRKIVTKGAYDLLSKLKNSEEHAGH